MLMRHEAGFQSDRGIPIEARPVLRLGGLGRGTRVLTPRGPVAVEALRRLDQVIVREGGPSRLIAAEARAARVAAVRIAAESLGLGMPARDLLVGPATRLWLPRQSRPIEAARLVDGIFVIEEAPCGLTLWTVTPITGGVVLAEGVAVAA